MSSFIKTITIVNENNEYLLIDVYGTKPNLLSGSQKTVKTYYLHGTKTPISKRSADGLFIVEGYDTLFK